MKCQANADNIHVAPSALHNLTSPWLFSMWGLDMIGQIEPKASNGHKIKHHNSTPYHPKMNGAVKVANKNIKKIIPDFSMDFHGATPYSLVYGTKVVLPIEVEIPSLRVLVEAELDDAEWVQSRLDQLKLIEEKRLMAIYDGQLYQRRIKNAFDKKVRPRVFKEGDLVLKKILPNSKNTRGKWAPN
ncbi:hypothetical protein CR513_34094, partial [Mucuna pruriens]